MAIDINLLPQLGKEKEKRKKLLVILNFSAIGLLALTLLILIGAFFYKSIVEKGYENIQKESATQKALLKQYESVEIQLSEVKQRVGKVQSILDSRKEYLNLLSNLEKITPRKIIYNSLTVDDDDLVSLTGNCPSYDELFGFLKALSGEWEQLGLTQPADSEVLFTKVELTSVGRNESTYDITFSVNFTAEEGAYNAQ